MMLVGRYLCGELLSALVGVEVCDKGAHGTKHSRHHEYAHQNA